MSRLFVRTLLVLAAIVLLGHSQARAGMVDFGYSWSVAPAVVSNGTGSVTLATAPDDTGHATLGSMVGTHIPGANVTSTSSAVAPPDHYDVNFTLKLTLTDRPGTPSSKSGDLTFSGHLSGDLTKTSSSVKVEFLDPVTQDLKLHNHVYTVTINPSLVPLPVPGADPAQLNALVTVKDVSTVNTPEPSTLALGSAALALLGVFSRRRKRS